MSFTDVDKWIVGEIDIFLAHQVVLGKKVADSNLRQGSRTVSSSIWRSATWALRVVSLAFAMILLMVGCVAAQQIQPLISVNGASGGTTVTAGASMSVAVANGPGNATDWIGVCNAGVPISPTQCDYAGYSWDYLNCTQTAPTTGVTSATCSLPAPSGAGNYYAIFFSNDSYNVLASAPFQATSPSSPSITVNGTSSGTTVSAGASMSIAVANGPGNPRDWIGVCNSGATPAFEQCDGAGYSWDYLNCTQTPPGSGSTSASCTLAAPGAGGNYIVGFFSNDTYTLLASAPITVTGTPPSDATLVQAIVVSQPYSTVSSSPQQCTNPFGPGSAINGQPVGTGHTVVGWVHGSNISDNNLMWPNWIKDNLGNTYIMVNQVEWKPWHEYIVVFYLQNVQGNPTSFIVDFSQYPASGSTILGPCDLDFAEYSNVDNLVIADPNLVYGSTASIQISPTANARIWAFASPFGSANSSILAGWLRNSGYSFILNDWNNDMGGWQSNALVAPGTITLTWDSPLGSPGTCPGIGGGENGCPTVVAAVALQ
jgi:hypothetical protein